MDRTSNGRCKEARVVKKGMKGMVLVGEHVTVAQQKRAVLFEMEHIGLQARARFFEATREVVADGGAELARVQYVKHCIGLPPAQFLPRVLKKNQDIEKIMKLDERIHESVLDALTGGSVAFDQGMLDLVKAAADKGMGAGALSCFEERDAIRIAQCFDLEAAGIRWVGREPDATEVPSTDAWLRLARKVQAPPSLCVALVSSAAACHAALAAGIRTFVLPDPFTTHQDFGGCEAIFEPWTPEAAQQVLGVLESF
jgi:beta-phosphoglucomutase-like phosphatase (HAD superfamily)